MTAWNIETFFDKFQNGTLGRKSQYSTYWVNKFDGCNILCNKSSGHRGARDGERIVAIYMGPDLCLFNGHEAAGVGKFIPRNVMMFEENDKEFITESGIIEIQATRGNSAAKSILFQIGISQYLIEPYWSQKNCVNYEAYVKLNDSAVDIMASYLIPPITRSLQYGFNSSYNNIVGANLVKLPEKFNSIEQARMTVIPDMVKEKPAESFAFRNWWFTPQPHYVPFALSQENKSKLKNPPMPWEYGLTVDHVTPILTGTSAFEANITRIQHSLGDDLSNNIKRYIQAKNDYELAIAQYKATFVDQDDDRNLSYSSFAILPSPGIDFGVERVGEIYYVRGALHDKEMANTSIGWRYGGLERLVKTKCVKRMSQWHSMVKGVGYV